MGENLRPSKSLRQNNSHLCARKRMTSSRRNSMDMCSTEILSKHVTAEKPRNVRHSMPVNTSSYLTSGNGDSEHLAQESPHLTTGTNNSTNLAAVSLDPPITRALLRELDISRLEKDLVLRHHLNFDPESEYRVVTKGPAAEARRERSCQYWRALSVEIALWLGHFQRMNNSHSSRPSCISLPTSGSPTFPQVATLRLPRLLSAVQDILKHLLPSEERPVIDAALDLKLLTQQLEHGVYDFRALSDWLGDYLTRFCSPMRDYMAHTMTSAIGLGVENAETSSILDGLKTVFEILQVMSLDATNHSLKILRLSWVEDTVAFEQTVFRRHMADGWDVMGARLWFEDLHEANEDFSHAGLWTLVKALTDAVVYYHQYFPPTLTLDYSRLRHLQFDFQVLFYQEACRWTLTQTLRNLEWTGKLHKEPLADLFCKVAVLISDPGLQYDFSQRRESVALEVVRAAYAICGNCNLPRSHDLDFAEDMLRRCCEPGDDMFIMLRTSLAADLADKVDDEVSAIGDLTPEQLARRLRPQQPGFEVRSEAEALVHIAKRIAHISELHWRVWGPILYQRPVDAVGRELSHGLSVAEGLDGRGRPPSSGSEASEESDRISGFG